MTDQTPFKDHEQIDPFAKILISYIPDHNHIVHMIWKKIICLNLELHFSCRPYFESEGPPLK